MEIGFVQSLYTASEGDIPVEVCVEIKQGSLGVPVIISILSTDSTYGNTYIIIYAFYLDFVNIYLQRQPQ